MTTNPQPTPMDEFHLQRRIAERGEALAATYGVHYPMPLCLMDLRVCIENNGPLRLQELLDADDGNFGHDVFGIRKYLDRETGKLTECFSPRFSV